MYFFPGERLGDPLAISSASGWGLLFWLELFPPTTWNPSQSNCFSQLQHLKIAALVSFKNSLGSACHYLLKMFLKSPIRTSEERGRFGVPAFLQRVTVLLRPRAQPLPLSRPRFPLLGTRIWGVFFG